MLADFVAFSGCEKNKFLKIEVRDDILSGEDVVLLAELVLFLEGSLLLLGTLIEIDVFALAMSSSSSTCSGILLEPLLLSNDRVRCVDEFSFACRELNASRFPVIDEPGSPEGTLHTDSPPEDLSDPRNDRQLPILALSAVESCEKGLFIMLRI